MCRAEGRRAWSGASQCLLEVKLFAGSSPPGRLLPLPTAPGRRLHSLGPATCPLLPATCPVLPAGPGQRAQPSPCLSTRDGVTGKGIACGSTSRRPSAGRPHSRSEPEVRRGISSPLPAATPPPFLLSQYSWEGQAGFLKTGTILTSSPRRSYTVRATPCLLVPHKFDNHTSHRGPV